ncbi:putative Ig domain-containing protein [Mucilaginibacter sp. SMC90]|uniref:putative Ig domain-containing protein n=1 Tax=Mucilaginibacter sp. SMC90 TaxID=2929803 RepID=UPI001FB53722|nr:putative Ig domain-containing protein [Mucilaginibacter sp. SMC90]UOE47599.1 putative Ig domain-containing protein [Mucilaginibacter sp. SMC90]
MIKKIFTMLLLLGGTYLGASAQDVQLKKGWKFAVGDSAQWSSPTFNDQHWQNIDVAHSWEPQGHPNYDGFGWYRIHVVIPSSLKEKAYLKDSLRLNLASVDDNDEVYLNGKLIAKYGGRSGTIKDGNYGQRTYNISASDPAILWDKENVLAIRIYDTGGDGGIYGDNFSIGMADVMDHVTVNTDGDYSFEENNSLAKSVKLVTTNKYQYQGTLAFKVTDPETGAVIYEKSNPASFTAGKPFTYSFVIARLAKKSYTIAYTFSDQKSGKDINKTETTPYILTPYPSAKPKINGADVYGARPGNPFLYLIPATGKKPLSYKADGLPAGLTLDAKTGIITGVVNQKGDYPVTLTVTNKLGSKTKTLTISIGDKIGLTPALGWNSWNAWGLSVNDEKVKISAKEMSEKLSSYGWNYINIDDGWEAENRAADGAIVANSKFPDMKGLTDYVHSLGLHTGIYSSPGPRTCGGFLGSWQHEDQDAKTYADWGFDYLKYDWCSYSEVTPPHPDLPALKKPYELMRSSLNKVNRDIMFSFCQYGWGDVWKWGAETGGNSWRTTGDIQDTWRSMSDIGFGQDPASPYAGPGHFNDPDMLVVGKVGWGPSLHNTRLTYDEQYTHISLWSLLSAPLLIGCDMGHLDRFTLSLLTNDEVLAIDQDALGKGARQASKTEEQQVWVKELNKGEKAIGFFNTSDKYQTVNLDANDKLLKGFTKARDVWEQKYLIAVNHKYTFKIPPHGVKLIRVM